MSDNLINKPDHKSLEGRNRAAFERCNLRHEAELLLAKQPKLATTDTLPADELLQELQVHQIELEMQNEELRRAHIALEESRDRYLDLFEFAPVGYLTLSSTGLITEVNFSAAELLGCERKKLLQRPFSRYIAPEWVNQFHLYMARLSCQNDKKNCDMQIKRENGELRFIHLDTLPVKAEDGTVTVRITLIDITERKQAEEELRIAAKAFEVQEAMMVTDTHNTIMRVNKAFTRITGHRAEEATGKPSSILKSGQHDNAFYQAIFEAIDRNQYWQGEIWNQRKNGELFPSLMNITAVTDTEGQVTHYVGSFLDITVQKQAEKVLLDARKHLEKQVEKTVADLTLAKVEAEEVNTALRVMIKLRETESSDAKNLLILELKQEVMPFLQKLKGASREPKQVRLLNALDSNLQRLITSYGSASSLSSVYKALTPKEIQVASMVREGASTKAIAATLSLSPETISIHRKNIRSKLGLSSKSDNLRSYLITLHN
ncbi:MAG: PAS domain S-box protein [Methylotenera sp.]|nr:PAS domain S-box protein [Methylotenera sp.]MDP2281763.1 PAS domain S-box protein [Methylotenera sp.]MDP3059299.1 PAS domain S-box protein [Methylotenera sp.]